ncbi:putative LPS biosynthesis related glycosyltransferase [uncultured Desulfatiglans sp.]|uniref:Putative LPS biosynthesis related glycosyltransferase n=1 Tax=Uncultured Desulfatiglans sp. TaxID=1748965 RepID=A0A653A8S6_UNCDX|nr:putative LPS biosynthesis related glycosyltransferase [uncultured Desulfatiglans sp.]
MLCVNFAKWWPNFSPERNFLVNALRMHFDVEIAANPDILFFSVFQGELPAGDYLKVFYTGEASRPDMSAADWAFSYEYDEDFHHPRHLRVPLYAIEIDGRAFRDDWGRELVKTGDYADRIMAERRRDFCAYVAYKDAWARCAMFDRLAAYHRVVAPGLSRNNAPPISDGDPGRSRGNGEFQALKCRFFQTFRFALVFENRSYRGYTSEKLVDAMRAGCIPIYWGNPAVAREFNPRSFINVSDYEAAESARFPGWLKRIPFFYKVFWRYCIMPRAMDRAASVVREMDTDPGLQRAVLAEPWFHKNQPNRYFDPSPLNQRMREIGESALARRQEGRRVPR